MRDLRPTVCPSPCASSMRQDMALTCLSLLQSCRSKFPHPFDQVTSVFIPRRVLAIARGAIDPSLGNGSCYGPSPLVSAWYESVPEDPSVENGGFQASNPVKQSKRGQVKSLPSTFDELILALPPGKAWLPRGRPKLHGRHAKAGGRIKVGRLHGTRRARFTLGTWPWYRSSLFTGMNPFASWMVADHHGHHGHH